MSDWTDWSDEVRTVDTMFIQVRALPGMGRAHPITPLPFALETISAAEDMGRPAKPGAASGQNPVISGGAAGKRGAGCRCFPRTETEKTENGENAAPVPHTAAWPSALGPIRPMSALDQSLARSSCISGCAVT